MGTKVKELDNTHDGNRSSCPICNPLNQRKVRRISEDQLWHWALAQKPPVQPLRENT